MNWIVLKAQEQVHNPLFKTLQVYVVWKYKGFVSQKSNKLQMTLHSTPTGPRRVLHNQGPERGCSGSAHTKWDNVRKQSHIGSSQDELR